MKFEKSCGAIVYCQKDELKFLLIHNKKGSATGYWGFPKGHMEENETEIETAKREIEEETGLLPTMIDNFRVTSRYAPYRGSRKIVVYFLAKSDDETVMIQAAELSDFKWCSYPEALQLLSYERDKLNLEKAKNFIDRF